jgi:hypothetical protein
MSKWDREVRKPCASGLADENINIPMSSPNGFAHGDYEQRGSRNRTVNNDKNP